MTTNKLLRLIVPVFLLLFNTVLANNSFTSSLALLDCNLHEMEDLPLQLIDGAGTAISFSIDQDVEIEDLNVILQIDHTWIGDLEVLLIGPNGQEVTLFNRPGRPATATGCSEDDLDLIFDDEATNTAADLENTCMSTSDYAIEGTYQAIGNLSDFNGTSSLGNWQLIVWDYVPEDNGKLNSFGLEICGEEEVVVTPPSIISLINNEALDVVQGNPQTITSNNLEATSDDLESEDIIYTLNSVPQNGNNIALNGIILSAGQTFTQEDIDEGDLVYNYVPTSGLTLDQISFDITGENAIPLENISLPINITVNNLAATSAIQNQIDCHNNNNGQIIVNALGGTPPFQYSIDEGENFQTNNSFKNLSAGIYTALVMDANNFISSTSPITIFNPPPISVTATANENTITVDAAGGMGNLEYSLDGFNFQSSNIFSNLPNGAYTVTVKDVNNCTVVTQALEILINTLSVSSSLVSQISCAGLYDGAFTVNVSGGNPPFQYSINGNTPQSNNYFSGLGSGSYTVEVIDNDGFVKTTNTIQIIEPSAISVSSQITGNAVIVFAVGGTGDLQYSLDGINFQNSNIFTDLPNGDIIITVRDANGCIQTITESILVNTLGVNASLVNQVSCFGATDGAFTVNVIGGTAPFQYSLDGGITFQNSNYFSGLSIGNYTATVMDADGFTQVTNTIQILEPSQLTSYTEVNENVIVVNANGGTGNLQYSIDGFNFQTSNVFGGLENGAYIITIRDDNGCTTTTQATILVNNLSASASAVNQISCFGSANGSLTVNATNGNKPYQYSINGGSTFQNSNYFTNLAPGTYSVLVIDEDGFDLTTNDIQISEPSEIIASAEVIETTIKVNASGGTGNLEYSLNGINFQGSNSFGGLNNGDYTVTIRDDNFCTKTTQATVLVNTLASSASIVNQIDCNGSTSGSITVNVTGGKEPFEYSIDNGNTFQNNNYFENLSSGTYAVFVLDADGFDITTNIVTLEEPSQLFISTTIDLSTIEINASGGTGNLEYSIDGIVYQDAPIFTNAENGAYTLYVKDANGCIETTEAIVAVNSLVANANLTQSISCHNAADAIIEISVAGGNAPYKYSLNEGTPQDESTFSNLQPGDYQIVVTDADGFEIQSNSITIFNPPLLTAEYELIENTITVNAIGGTQPLLFQLNGGDYQNSPTFSNLPNGEYTIITSDANSCVTVGTVTIMVNTLSVSATTTESISCYNGSNGIIEVNIVGGNAPYEYSLDGVNFQDSNIFENLSAGTYEISVRDADGFIEETNEIILENPLELTATNSTTDNTVIVNATGGTGDLEYSINGIDFQDSNIFTDLENGTYTISVRDANGCIKTTNTTIAVNNLAISMNLQHLTCYNSNDGTIKVTVSGGIEPILYSLDGESFQLENVFNNLESGDYEITVKDAEDFILVGSPVTLNTPSALSLELTVDQSMIIAEGNGGTGNLQYSLDGVTFQDSPIFNDLPNGDYEVFIRDENGCTTSMSAVVEVVESNPLLVVSFSTTNISCHNAQNGSISVNVSGGLSPYMYSLDGENFQSENEFNNLEAGTYNVIIQDAQGFSLTSSDFEIINPDPVSIELIVDENTVEVDASGGTGTLLYTINGGNNYQESNLFPNLENGEYTIGVIDENGCFAMQDVTINITTSTSEISISNIEVFPNPSNGQFKLTNL